jgi:hypothetical protein
MPYNVPHCSNGNMLVIRVYLKPLLGALACVNEKSPVHIATTTPGRFMVKGVQNGTEITFELFCFEVVQETSSRSTWSEVKLVTRNGDSKYKLLGRKNPNESWSVDMFCTFLDAG